MKRVILLGLIFGFLIPE